MLMSRRNRNRINRAFHCDSDDLAQVPSWKKYMRRSYKRRERQKWKKNLFQ